MTNQFNNYENMSMLWEIIYDLYNTDAESKGKSMNANMVSSIKDNFVKNSNNFLENAIKSNSQMDLMTLNKTFISSYVNNSNNHSQRETSIKPIKIEKSEPELITFEEIQKNRRSEFEETLKLKKMDFENSIKNNVPDTIEFKVGNIDEPIGEMDALIAARLAERKYDIEQIHNQYTNTNTNDVKKWLQPQETSLLSEKMPIHAEHLDNSQIDSRYEPYIPSNNQLINEPIKHDNQNDNKHVTWGNDTTINNEERNEIESTSNIFSKLKIKTLEKMEPLDKNNVDKNNVDKNNVEFMNIIKTLQEDVISLKDNMKNINTLLAQLLENKIE
jgi:hypothetical protein